MCRWLFLLLWIPGFGPLWAQSVVINELVSSNHTGLEDEDGDRPDWIELYNPGSAAINLAGYGISDEAKSPFKWRFPRRLLAAHGFLVVFASGKDRTNSTRLHTSFRLAAIGETVILSRPDGQVLDQVRLPGLPPDIAFGRQPDGASTLRFLATPSPAAPNLSASGNAALKAPSFSQPAGFYANSLTLELHSSDPDTHILYTLDGSEPNALSARYEHPFSVVDRSSEPNGISMISGTSTNNQHTDGWKAPKGLVRKITVIRARAYREGALPSPTVGHSYAIGPATNAGLPVISLSLAPESLFDFDRGIYMLGRTFVDWRRSHPSEVLTGHTPANYTQRGPDWERPALLEYFDPAGALAFSRDVRLDIQGQSSRSFRQKSLGVKTVAGAIPYELFPGLRRHGDGTPLHEFQHLRLRNSGNDWAYTLFRDALCHRLAEGLGIDTEAYRPVIVFLNGEYWGIHNIREQHDADYLHSHYDVPKEQAVICSADGSLVEGPTNANQSFLDLRHYLETHDLSVPVNYELVTRQIDIRNFIRYHAACVYFGNADWPHNNLQVWRTCRVRRTEAPCNPATAGGAGCCLIVIWRTAIPGVVACRTPRWRRSFRRGAGRIWGEGPAGRRSFFAV